MHHCQIPSLKPTAFKSCFFLPSLSNFGRVKYGRKVQLCMVRIKITSGGDKCEQEEMWARRKPSKQSPAVGAGSGRLGSAGRRQSGGLLCKKLTTIFFAQLFPYRSLAFLGHRKTVFLCLVLLCVRVRVRAKETEKGREREREREREWDRTESHPSLLRKTWTISLFQLSPHLGCRYVPNIFPISPRKKQKERERRRKKLFSVTFL